MKILILDSFGWSPISQSIIAKFPNIKWGFHNNPFEQHTNKRHPHAGLCAWNIISQLDKETEYEIMFGQITDENGNYISSSSGKKDWEWWFDLILDWKPDYINASWASSSTEQLQEMFLDMYFGKGWIQNFLGVLAEAKSDIFFAASNDGHFVKPFPQIKLSGYENVHIIGACDPNGIPSKFSSAPFESGRYTDVTYLGESMLSVNVENGLIIPWDGTSGAAPYALGDMAARKLKGVSAKNYWRAKVLEDANHNDKPDGVAKNFVDFIKNGGFHPKVGVGVADLSRQENVRKTGNSIDLGSNSDILKSVRLMPTFHDFKKVNY